MKTTIAWYFVGDTILLVVENIERRGGQFNVLRPLQV